MLSHAPHEEGGGLTEEGHTFFQRSDCSRDPRRYTSQRAKICLLYHGVLNPRQAKTLQRHDTVENEIKK